jgi:hypothetical protein
MTQPIHSGAPLPVFGVTGGPPVLGGQIGNDPSSGNIVITPTPGNATQIRKGAIPQTFQVYEYFNSNTDFSRISVNTQAGGPFQVAVETQPPSVIRDLQILTPGVVTIPHLQVPGPRFGVGGVVSSPSTTSASFVDMPDMSITFTLAIATTVFMWFTGAFVSTAIGNQVATAFVLDNGTPFATNIFQTKVAGPNNAEALSNNWIINGLVAGTHTLKMQWSVQSGTLSNVGGIRYLTMFG